MNPRQGAMYSENLPSEWVVETSRPFMGTIISEPMNWSPESTQFRDLQVKSEPVVIKAPVVDMMIKEVNKDVVVKVADDSTSSSDSDSDSTVGSPDTNIKAEMLKQVPTEKLF